MVNLKVHFQVVGCCVFSNKCRKKVANIDEVRRWLYIVL